MRHSPAPATEPRPLRILEIGSGNAGRPLFADAVPEQTDSAYTGSNSGRLPLLGPIHFWRVLRRLRRGDYDLLVLYAARVAPWHPRSFLRILRDRHLFALRYLFAPWAARALHLFHRTPVVAIDFQDTFSIQRHNFRLLDRATVYFKRELPADRWLVFFKTGHWGLPGRRFRTKRKYRRRLDKIRPLSIGTDLPEGAAVMEEKSVDVFFAGDLVRGATSRSDGIAEIEKLAGEGFTIEILDGNLPKGEFLARMSRAWIAWSPPGLGWDCFRHYEAPLMGAVPLMTYPTLFRDMPLVEGEHCLFYAPEPGRLGAAVKQALADKATLARIARDGQAHCRAHHTPRARAERVTIAAIGRRLDGTPVA